MPVEIQPSAALAKTELLDHLELRRMAAAGRENRAMFPRRRLSYSSIA